MKTPDFLKNYKKYLEHSQKADEFRTLIVDEISNILKTLKLKPSGFYDVDIKISTKTFDPDEHHVFAGIECYDIWEINLGDRDFVSHHTIPTSIFKSDNIKSEYDKIISEFHDKCKSRANAEKIKRQKMKEEHELKEYKRLKRKYDKTSEKN